MPGETVRFYRSSPLCFAQVKYRTPGPSAFIEIYDDVVGEWAPTMWKSLEELNTGPYGPLVEYTDLSVLDKKGLWEEV